MKEFNIDFHIHSRESGGTSPNMTIPLIARQAELKGLHAVGTGDALHPGWLAHLKENLTEGEGGFYSTFRHKTKFLVTTEVEDAHRVHHVILFPSVESAEKMSRKLSKHSVDIEKDGRPHIRLDAEKIVDVARGVGALIGPSHAFTPWTAVYKEFQSLAECYKSNLEHVTFLELGLSANSDYADRISELTDLTFMTNSDCHSPWPHRLGREFNRLKLKKLSFTEVKKALVRNGGRKFTLNVGLNPREGKYHLTSCTRCYLRFTSDEAKRLKRCPDCGGIIKTGVADRINELATWPEPHHPSHRPPYIHILPLAEVIALSMGISSPTSKKVQAEWERLVKAAGSEINALIDAPIDEIQGIDHKVGSLIKRFREGRVSYVAGGGGQYGRPTLTGEKNKYWGQGQKKLGDF